jgi:aldehyde:ferredoxin oxidoreductase
METPLDMRVRLGTENFGQITNPRGGHLERTPSITFIPRKIEAIKKYSMGIGAPDEAVERICREGPEGFNVARLTKWVEDYNTVSLSLGLCHRTPLAQQVNPAILAELYGAATGIEMGSDELLKAGERVWTIQKAFNIREGAGREDDLPPQRVLADPIVISGRTYGPVDREAVKKMMDDYYEERGWNVEKGVPDKEKLLELGLESVKL